MLVGHTLPAVILVIKLDLWLYLCSMQRPASQPVHMHCTHGCKALLWCRLSASYFTITIEIINQLRLKLEMKTIFTRSPRHTFVYWIYWKKNQNPAVSVVWAIIFLIIHLTLVASCHKVFLYAFAFGTSRYRSKTLSWRVDGSSGLDDHFRSDISPKKLITWLCLTLKRARIE